VTKEGKGCQSHDFAKDGETKCPDGKRKRSIDSFYISCLSIKGTYVPPLYFNHDPKQLRNLSLVRTRTNITTPTSPVNMDILTDLVLRILKLRLDLEGVRAKVISLRLQQVGGQILGAVAVEPGERGGEGRGGDAEEGGLGDDVAPAGLRFVDGFVEEVVEEEVLEVVVGAVGGGDVLEEDGADDAASAPHEGDGGLVELPFVFFRGLEGVRWDLESRRGGNIPLAST
jgi:hypothetical protein